MTRSERTLWRRWVERRDGDAFAALVRRHARFVYDFARRVAGNAADAEDLTQEAYLKLAEAEPQEPDAVGLRAFLGRRVVLGARMLKRAALARRRHEGLATHPGGAGGPEDLARREEAQKALDLLPAGERRAVELRFLHDLSYSEIGDVLGTTEEAARMRVHRGLERMRARFGASACLAALALFEPPARMLASTAKTALLTGGVVVAQAAGKKAAILVGLALLLGLIGTAAVKIAGSGRGQDTASRAPRVREPMETASRDASETAVVESAPVEPRISGVVVDAEGTPVQNATVRVLRLRERYEWVETSTGVDGRFAFDVQHRCMMEARHPSYAMASITADTGVETRIVLPRGVPVRVEVRGGGRPVEGARVAATPGHERVFADARYRAPGEGVTDARGVAEFHVPEGRFQVWANGAGWAPKLAPPIVCALGRPQEVRLELVPGGVVEGTARDRRGGAAAGARVVVRASPGFHGQTTTGRDGRYVVEHVPLVSEEWLTVVADHPEHAATSTSRIWNEADGDRLRFDLVLPETARLHGVALDAMGHAIASRRLAVFHQGGLHVLYSYPWLDDRWPFSGTTDAQGKFEIAGLPPGKATLYLLPDTKDSIEIELVAGELNGPIELRLAGVAVRGRVIDAEGNPVARAGIHPGGVLTDGDGRFALKERPKRIVVAAPNHAAVVHAIDGDDVTVRLGGAALAGTVIDPDGRGLPDVTVTLQTYAIDQFHHTESRTDARGGFRFRGASTGAYQLAARAPGRDLVGGVRSLSEAGDDIVLVVASSGEAERRLVRGTVVDESGHPIDETVSYRVFLTGTKMVAAGSGARRAGQPGSFVCEQIEPLGEVRIVLNARGYLNSEPITVVFDGRAPIEPLTVTLRRGAEVEVFVCEQDRTPVPGASVFGYAANAIDGRTDAEGRCILTGLPPGRNRITAGHPYLTDVNEANVDATVGVRQRVEFRGKAVGMIAVRIPAEPRPKTSLLFRLTDARGAVAREDRFDALQFAGIVYMGHYDMSVTTPGTYRIQCEIDGVALPEAEVEARLRETTEIDLKPAR
jgi:RNA polymerase sigma-70 factor (ECF subfamily)